MTWIVEKWNGTSWKRFSFSELSIKKSLDELNTAKISTSEFIPSNTLVRCLYDTKEVFRGYVQKIDTETGNLYSLDVVEAAIELKKQLVNVGGSYRVEWISKTANEIIDDILSGSGWTRGSSNTTVFNTVYIEFSDRLKAISKIVKDMLGLHLWFDSVNKVVYFGTRRTDRTTTPIVYADKKISEDSTEVYDGVIVLGAGDGKNQLMAQRGTGTNFKVVLAKDAKSQEEVDKIADVLYASATVPQKRVELNIALWPEVEEGDLVRVDGENLVVYELEHTLSETTLSLGSSRPSLAKVLQTKLKGVEEVGYVGQGATCVSNFGGWETAVDSTHPAKYIFYLPDSSVGLIRVNECFINVYGRSYRIWSRGVAAGNTGEDANWGAVASSSDWNVWRPGEIPCEKWVTLFTYTPSSLQKDPYFAFVEIVVKAEKVDSHGWCSWQARLRNTNTNATWTSANFIFTSAGSGVQTCTSTIIAFSPGSRNDTYAVDFRFWDIPDRVHVWAKMDFVSRHDHGTHIHPIETGIYETSEYPSNVEVWLYNSSYINGIKVADKNTHPMLAGGSEFSVTKIDVTNYVAPGKNTIEVRSASLGMVQVDGFYRIYVETSK